MTKKNQAQERCAGVRRHFVRRTKRNALVLSTVPTQEIPTAKSRKQKPDATEQSDQGKHAPNNRVRRCVIPDQRFRRPIVRVGVREIRAQGRTRPSRPAEEGRQLSDLLRVGDRRGPQSKFRRRAFQRNRHSKGRASRMLPPVRRILKHSRAAVVAIGFEVGDRLLLGGFGRRATIVLDGDEGGAMKVVCREVRTEIRAVSEDRAIFHQSVAEKHFLAGNHIRSREKDLSARINDLRRNRRLIRVGSIGEHAENQKTAQHNDHNRLHPSLRNQQCASCRARSSCSPHAGKSASTAGFSLKKGPEKNCASDPIDRPDGCDLEFYHSREEDVVFQMQVLMKVRLELSQTMVQDLVTPATICGCPVPVARFCESGLSDRQSLHQAVAISRTLQCFDAGEQDLVFLLHVRDHLPPNLPEEFRDLSNLPVPFSVFSSYLRQLRTETRDSARTYR